MTSTKNPTTLEIRKYPNRRYYDTTRSTHVTLEEIHKLIQDGKNVVIKDSKSGEDITAKILTQIILELDTGKLDFFPVSLLTRVIRTNENLVKDFMDTYFNQAFTTFLESHRKFSEQLKVNPAMSDIFGSVPDWARLVPGAWQNESKPPSPSLPQAQTKTPPSETHTPSELESLNQKLESIMKELEAIKAKKK